MLAAVTLICIFVHDPQLHVVISIFLTHISHLTLQHQTNLQLHWNRRKQMVIWHSCGNNVPFLRWSWQLSCIHDHSIGFYIHPFRGKLHYMLSLWFPWLLQSHSLHRSQESRPSKWDLFFQVFWRLFELVSSWFDFFPQWLWRELQHQTSEWESQQWIGRASFSSNRLWWYRLLKLRDTYTTNPCSNEWPGQQGTQENRTWGQILLLSFEDQDDTNPPSSLIVMSISHSTRSVFILFNIGKVFRKLRAESYILRTSSPFPLSFGISLLYSVIASTELRKMTQSTSLRHGICHPCRWYGIQICLFSTLYEDKESLQNHFDVVEIGMTYE